MPTFEHLSVLISIVVGVSVSQVLFGLSQLVRRRGTYEVDAPYLLCNLIVLLILVDSWWAAFSWHEVPGWTYRRTWFVMLNPLLVSMAAQLLPPDWDEKPLDFHKAYYRNHRVIFGLLAFYPLIDMVDAALKGAAHFKSLGPGYPITSVTMALLFVFAALISNRKVQFVCMLGVLLVVLSWIFEFYSVVPL